MPECEVCNASFSLSRTCSYCGTVTCTEHHLPEKHDCAASKLASDKWFSEKFSQQTDQREREDRSKPEPIDARAWKHPISTDRPVNPSSPDVAPDGSLIRNEEQSVEVAQNTDWTTGNEVSLQLRRLWATWTVKIILVAIFLILATHFLGIQAIIR